MAPFVTKYLRIAGGVAELEQPLRPTGRFSERTAWVGRLTPLRRFVRTETGGAAVLVAAVLAALVWANVGGSYHPWTSYAIVPLFALANAGIAIDGELLRRATGSPVTIGVLLGFLAGKPLGTFGMSLAVTRLSRGRLRPPVGWAAVISAGTITGLGFTVSLLVACLAFTGAGLDEAKLGLLGAAALAPALTWMVIRATRLLPRPRRINALLGGAAPLVDLA